MAQQDIRNRKLSQVIGSLKLNKKSHYIMPVRSEISTFCYRYISRCHLVHESIEWFFVLLVRVLPIRYIHIRDIPIRDLLETYLFEIYLYEIYQKFSSQRDNQKPKSGETIFLFNLISLNGKIPQKNQFKVLAWVHSIRDIMQFLYQLRDG